MESLLASDVWSGLPFHSFRRIGGRRGIFQLKAGVHTKAVFWLGIMFLIAGFQCHVIQNRSK